MMNHCNQIATPPAAAAKKQALCQIAVMGLPRRAKGARLAMADPTGLFLAESVPAGAGIGYSQ
jgi:hypothetical protein